VWLSRLAMASLFLVALAGGLLGWLWLAERLVARLRPSARQGALAWLWLTPALLLVTTYLAWPLLNTIWISLQDRASGYQYLVTDPAVRSALRNNLIWLVLLTGGCLVVGVVVAVLADRVRYEAIAKAAIVLPTAIPFVAGAVVWRFMYLYQPPGLPQTGTANAIWTTISGAAPVAWLVDGATNNPALVTVGVWMTAGFATVILSAALKSVPTELQEAARIDGASSWQVFRHITLPHLRPTLLVTTTLLAITAFKAFDIVYAMTNGNFDTDVIANVMYRQLFVAGDSGRASAIAVLLAVVALPILLLNARALRTESENR
jgi:alpha-glucoside transport system permease protein